MYFVSHTAATPKNNSVEQSANPRIDGMNRPILIFLGVCFGLSLAVSLIVGMTGGNGSPFIWLRWSTMFLPAIAVLVAILTGERPELRSERKFSPVYVVAALLLMPLLLHAVMMPMILMSADGNPWQSWLRPAVDGLFHPPPERGWGNDLTRSQLILRMALNATIGLGVVSILAFFEEIGWRAWLLPRFSKRFGDRRAIVAVSAIWALWHTPFVLSGILSIEAIPVHLLVIILALGHFGSGLVIGWFWWRTQSIALVAIAHGALNNWGQFAFKFMRDFGQVQTTALAAGGAALTVLGGVLLAFSPRARSSLERT
jgi:membrane protease YdiL (CAAX protease family)